MTWFVRLTIEGTPTLVNLSQVAYIEATPKGSTLKTISGATLVAKETSMPDTPDPNVPPHWPWPPPPTFVATTLSDSKSVVWVNSATVQKVSARAGATEVDFGAAGKLTVTGQPSVIAGVGPVFRS
jgi:hypothetical protein